MKQSTNPNVWTRKTGETILIKKMEDVHIIRAMRKLEQFAAEREVKLRMRLSAVVNSTDVSCREKQTAKCQLEVLDVKGFPISTVFIQYPKLCEAAVKRGLLL